MLIEAIKGGEPDAAARAMEQHLDHIARRWPCPTRQPSPVDLKAVLARVAKRRQLAAVDQE